MQIFGIFNFILQNVSFAPDQQQTAWTFAFCTTSTVPSVEVLRLVDNSNTARLNNSKMV
jgi:hypothetical protein